MGFYTSGSLIRLSGTTVGLTGLKGLTGVEYLEVGSGASIRTVYMLDRCIVFDVGGDLTIDPEHEEILYTEDAADATYSAFDMTASTATLTVGEEHSVNGGTGHDTRVSWGTWFYSCRDATGTTNADSAFYTDQDAGIHVYVYGGLMMTHRLGVLIRSSCTVRRMTFCMPVDFAGVSSIRFQCGITNTISVIGLECNSTVFLGGTIDDFAGVVVRSPITNATLALLSTLPNGSYMYVDDWESYDIKNDVLMYPALDKSTVLRNPYIGAALTFIDQDALPGSAGAFREIQGTVIDAVTQLPVEGATFRYKDADNGNRFDKATYLDIPEYPGTADQDIAEDTDVNGDYSVDLCLVGAWSPPAGPVVRDVRIHNVGGQGVERFYLFSWGHYPVAVDRPTTGYVGPLVIDARVIPDGNTTESDGPTIAGWTQINTLERLYDRSKYHNTTIELSPEFPAPGVLAINAQGSTLDLGDLSLYVRDLPESVGGTEVDVSTLDFDVAQTEQTNLIWTNYEGWYKDATRTYRMSRDDPPTGDRWTPSDNTGPDKTGPVGPYATLGGLYSGDHFAYTEGNIGAIGVEHGFRSNTLEIQKSPTHDTRLSFAHYAFIVGMGEYYVQAGNAGVFGTKVWEGSGNVQVDAEQDWDEVDISLLGSQEARDSLANGTNFAVRFRHIPQGSPSDHCLSRIRVYTRALDVETFQFYNDGAIGILTDNLATTEKFNTINTTGVVTISDGATYDPYLIINDANGQRAPFELTGLIPGSEVRVYDTGTTTELGGIESSTDTFVFSINTTDYPSVDVVILSTEYQNLRFPGEPTVGGRSISIQQRSERVYENPT